MNRLEKVRSEIEDLVAKSTSVHRSRKQVLDTMSEVIEVLSDVSDVIEDSLRKHEGIEFTGKNWGLVMKLVVLDDMLVSDSDLVD